MIKEWKEKLQQKMGFYGVSVKHNLEERLQHSSAVGSWPVFPFVSRYNGICFFQDVTVLGFCGHYPQRTSNHSIFIVQRLLRYFLYLCESLNMRRVKTVKDWWTDHCFCFRLFPCALKMWKENENISICIYLKDPVYPRLFYKHLCQ